MNKKNKIDIIFNSTLEELGDNIEEIAKTYNVNIKWTTWIAEKCLLENAEHVYYFHAHSDYADYIINLIQQSISKYDPNKTWNALHKNQSMIYYETFDEVNERFDIQLALKCLSEKELEIIESSYGLNNKKVLTVDEIAKKMKLSDVYIYSIRNRAFDKLKAELSGYKYKKVHPKVKTIDEVMKSSNNERLKKKKKSKKSSENKEFDYNICIGKYKKSVCYHGIKNFKCPKVESCKKITNKTNGKCDCIYKHKCSPIRQSIQMKFRPSEATNFNCEFFTEYKKSEKS